MKVLVAEDDQTTRELVARLVEGWGYEVIAVENGAQAIQQLRMDGSPRLAILDWKMPLMTGVEVVCELRAQKRDAYTYVLLLTSESEKDRLLEALRSGCDDYITKPFDANELQARLFVGSRIVQLQEQLAGALETAQYHGSHDALTGAFNRRAVLSLLDRELARAARDKSSVAVLLLDLDRFKQINDSLGHMAGDEVIRQLVGRLGAAVRQYDIVGRYGGEEFVGILPKCTMEEGVAIAERVCESVRVRPLTIEGHELRVTVSVGVAAARPGTDIKLLLREADAAMYRAKGAGRNQVCAAVSLESQL